MESWVGVVALVEAQEVNNLELLLAEQRLSEKVVDGEHGEAVKKKNSFFLQVVLLVGTLTNNNRVLLLLLHLLLLQAHAFSTWINSVPEASLLEPLLTHVQIHSLFLVPLL